MATSEMVKVDYVATRALVSRKTIYDWIYKNRCPFRVIRLGGYKYAQVRFLRAEVDAFLAGQPVAEGAGHAQ